MKRSRTILSIFLLLGLGSAIYLWWHLSDEQKVLRQVDALCETVSVRTISLGDSERPIEVFRSLIDDPIVISAEGLVPSGTFTAEELIEHLRTYRTVVKTAKARRLEATVTFPGPDHAVVEALLEHEANWLRGSKTLDKIRAELDFRRTPEGWILTESEFRQAPGK